MLKQTRTRHILLRSSVACLLIAALAALVGFSVPAETTTAAMARILLVACLVLAAVTLAAGLRRTPSVPDRDH